MAERGRPTEYTPELVDKCKEYLELERPSLTEVIPSIEGLALYLGISRQTIHRWKNEEDKDDFCYIIEQILAKQGQTLLNNGLTGLFNSTISKVILTKHGYREGIEQSGPDGKPIQLEETTKAKIDDALGKLT